MLLLKRKLKPKLIDGILFKLFKHDKSVEPRYLFRCRLELARVASPWCQFEVMIKVLVYPPAKQKMCYNSGRKEKWCILKGFIDTALL